MSNLWHQSTSWWRHRFNLLHSSAVVDYIELHNVEEGEEETHEECPDENNNYGEADHYYYDYGEGEEEEKEAVTHITPVVCHAPANTLSRPSKRSRRAGRCASSYVPLVAQPPRISPTSVVVGSVDRRPPPPRRRRPRRIMRKLMDAMSSVWMGPDPQRLAELGASDRLIVETGSSAGLNGWEIRTLQKSWKSLIEDHDVGLICLRHIFEKYPESKAVFGMANAHIDVIVNDSRVRKQAFIIQDSVDMVITELGSGNVSLKWPLITLGEQHSRYAVTRGMKKEYLIAFGLKLLDLVSELPMHTLNRWKRWKIVRLWRRFVYFLLTCMVTGFQLGLAERPQALLSARNSSAYSSKSPRPSSCSLVTTRGRSSLAVPSSAIAESIKISAAAGAGLDVMAEMNNSSTTDTLRCHSTSATPSCASPTPSYTLYSSTTKKLRHTLSTHQTNRARKVAKHKKSCQDNLGGINAVVAESSVMLDVLQVSVRLKL